MDEFMDWNDDDERFGCDGDIVMRFKSYGWNLTGLIYIDTATLTPCPYTAAMKMREHLASRGFRMSKLLDQQHGKTKRYVELHVKRR